MVTVKWIDRTKKPQHDVAENATAVPPKTGSTQETTPNSGGVGKCLKRKTVGNRREGVEKPCY